jgi:twitching motility protein PilU
MMLPEAPNKEAGTNRTWGERHMDLLSKLLKRMVQLGASDLFLSTNTAPAFRVNGKLLPRDDEDPPLPPGATEKMCQLIMIEEHRRLFDEQLEMNMAFSLPGLGRFRVNVFKQRGDIALVIRSLAGEIPAFDKLRIPNTLKELVMLNRGLVLIVGPAGSGKSTTLASMLDHRNANDLAHIITVEDPIEYFLTHKQSVIHQREIGVDTLSYQDALTNAMRQSPDVLVIGEVRDRATLEHAIEYADTGHLCLATFHAHNTQQALERIVNMFDENRREQILLGLSMNVQAILSQKLIPDTQGGRVPAWELLRHTARTADLLRRGEFHELHEVIEKDVSTDMQTFDQSLYNLQQQGLISAETALQYADSVSNLRLQMRLSPERSNPEYGTRTH